MVSLVLSNFLCIFEFETRGRVEGRCVCDVM